MDENDCSPNSTVLGEVSENITSVKQMKESTCLNTVGSSLESITPRSSGDRPHQQVQKRIDKTRRQQMCKQ